MSADEHPADRAADRPRLGRPPARVSAERRPGPSVRVRVEELRAGEEPLVREDRLATEEPLEIRLAWPGRAAHRVWVTMRTPGHDFELAAGWALHEGLAPAPAAVEGVAYCTDRALSPQEQYNVVTVSLAAAPDHEPHRHDSLTAGSSACGVCGAESVADALTGRRATRWSGPLPGADVVRSLPERLRTAQPLFDRTGGVHAAGLATAAGDLLVVREDVGRHNAVDKVTGARILAGESPAAAALVVSGRAGFELVQKALAAGVGSLVAVGAPTSLAADLAADGGLALYGFTARGRSVRFA